jgi:ATP-dependent HslUV protease, peptidase subunit HslV
VKSARSSEENPLRPRIRSTTVLAVRRAGHVVIGGDGQVTMGNTVVKSTARKIRRLHDGKIVAGFAGSAADGITLFEKFEGKLKEYNGNLLRSAVELAKDWRTDRALRRLDAMLIVADKKETFLLTGAGDVLDPEHFVVAVGSGGNYALAAARALYDVMDDAEAIARKSMDIAADICVYTNRSLTVETLSA